MDSTVKIALISAIAPIVSAIITLWFTNRRHEKERENQIRYLEFQHAHELNKLNKEINNKVLSQKHEEKRQLIQNHIGELITATDPDITEEPNIPLMTRNILVLQLNLDLNNETERLLNDALSELGHSVTGRSLQNYLNISGKVIELGRDIIATL